MLVPILQALLVTFLWSTSFIIIKWGLSEIPPLTFAGLRYTIAFLVLLPWALSPKYRSALTSLSPRQWTRLAFLGVLFYSLTQGAMFIGLSLLPSVTVSLILNFSPIVVAVMGMVFINEVPTRIQGVGTALFIVGILVYFYPVSFIHSEWLGLMVMVVGVLVNAGSSVLGRTINYNDDIPPLIVTVVSMGIGAIILLIIGFTRDGVPHIGLTNSVLLLWMAVINTALAFTIWNVTLRSLTAMQSSIINGTMLIQIAILAWIFLGESISLKAGIGMTIAAGGAILVQLKFGRKTAVSIK
ncbi:MAG: DMT family transporter [Candidatus Marinimicrobia bacterium]|nr:DMT family transporter [Candidatus Neomarinimicrobiota bacterium]